VTGGVGVLWPGAVRATTLAHAVVCRRRWLDSNQISTIASRAFHGLTALEILYDAGLWARLSSLLAAWCTHGCGALRDYFTGLFPLGSIITSFMHFLTFLICAC
jgi:hypothetical protein